MCVCVCVCVCACVRACVCFKQFIFSEQDDAEKQYISIVDKIAPAKAAGAAPAAAKPAAAAASDAGAKVQALIYLLG